MNYILFHNTSCLGDVYSFQASFKLLKHPLRIPLKLVCVCVCGGGGVTCICHDTRVCNYFGYFFGGASGYLVIFLDCSRIFGHHFLVKFICLGITQIFGY